MSTVSFWGHAQTTQIGLRMGQTISNFQGDSTEDYDIRLTYHIGVSGAFHFRNNLSLQAEAFFSRQGAEYDKFNNDGLYIFEYFL